MRKMLLIIPAIVLLSGGATFALSSKKAPEPVRAVGEPKNCVTISQIRSTKVIDSSNIDFHMVGGNGGVRHARLRNKSLFFRGFYGGFHGV